MYEYKVVTHRDRKISGAFDFTAIDESLNRYAADGWRLAEGFQAQSAWKSIKADIVLILEREKRES